MQLPLRGLRRLVISLREVYSSPVLDCAMRVAMEIWASKLAEKILDDFVSYEGSDDLIKLHVAIAQALERAYESGRTGTAVPE